MGCEFSTNGLCKNKKTGLILCLNVYYKTINCVVNGLQTGFSKKNASNHFEIRKKDVSLQRFLRKALCNKISGV